MPQTLPYRHPNLFKTILAIVFVNLSTGFALIFDNPQHLISFNKIPQNGIIPPLPFWGVMFVIAGLMLLFGVFTKYYRVARYGLTLSTALGGFWAFGFVLNFYIGTIYGISAPILWVFYTLICITASNEPAANPLSQVLQQDIHKTLQTAKHRDHVLNKDHPSPNIPTTESKQDDGK